MKVTTQIGVSTCIFVIAQTEVVAQMGVNIGIGVHAHIGVITCMGVDRGMEVIAQVGGIARMGVDAYMGVTDCQTQNGSAHSHVFATFKCRLLTNLKINRLKNCCDYFFFTPFLSKRPMILLRYA